MLLRLSLALAALTPPNDGLTLDLRAKINHFSKALFVRVLYHSNRHARGRTDIAFLPCYLPMLVLGWLSPCLRSVISVLLLRQRTPVGGACCFSGWYREPDLGLPVRLKQHELHSGPSPGVRELWG